MGSRCVSDGYGARLGGMSKPIPLSQCHFRSYSQMDPSGQQTRYCSLCEKDVHDLSSMTAAEAARFLASSSNACVRYLHDGRRVLHRSRSKRALAVLAAATAPLLLEACGGARPRYDYDFPVEEQLQPSEPDAVDARDEPSSEETPPPANGSDEPDGVGVHGAEAD